MIDLYLMGYKGLSVLKAIVKQGLIANISHVIASRDPQMTDDYYVEIQDFSLKNNIAFLDRKQCDVSSDAKYSILIGWRWLIKGTDLSNLIVLHDSLLPKCRGFNPLVTALINGDSEVGVTAIFANQEFDKGNIICQRKLEIEYPIKIDQVIAAISEEYSYIVVDIVNAIASSNKLTGIPQDDKLATYSLWRDETDYLIDWSMDSNYIKRFIDSVGFPYKGASTFVGDKKVRILEASVEDDLVIENRVPGKVLLIRESTPIVVCGKGLLALDHVIADDTHELYQFKRVRIRLAERSTPIG